MTDNGSAPNDPRLPPPAFPSRATSRGASDDGVPDDAFISPDAPLQDGSIPEDAIFSPDDPVTRSGTRMPEDAFFSPDDPVVRETDPAIPEDFEDVMRSHASSSAGDDDEGDDGDVQVTGMGSDTTSRPRATRRFDDPHVEHLYGHLVTLARALREKGEAGLRTGSDMSRFETTLRGYCVGYLAGLREAPDPDG